MVEPQKQVDPLDAYEEELEKRFSIPREEIPVEEDKAIEYLLSRLKLFEVIVLSNHRK